MSIKGDAVVRNISVLNSSTHLPLTGLSTGDFDLHLTGYTDGTGSSVVPFPKVGAVITEISNTGIYEIPVSAEQNNYDNCTIYGTVASGIIIPVSWDNISYAASVAASSTLYISDNDLDEVYGNRNVDFIADLDGDNDAGSIAARRLVARTNATQDINDILRASKLLPMLPEGGLTGSVTWGETTAVIADADHTVTTADKIAIFWGSDYRRSEMTVSAVDGSTITLLPTTGYGFILPVTGTETCVYSAADPVRLIPSNIRDDDWAVPGAIADVALGFAIYWLSARRGSRKYDSQGNPITNYYQEWLMAKAKLDAIIKGEIALDFLYCKKCGERLDKHHRDDKQVCITDNACYDCINTTRIMGVTPGAIDPLLDNVTADFAYSGMVNGGPIV